MGCSPALADLKGYLVGIGQLQPTVGVAQVDQSLFVLPVVAELIATQFSLDRPSVGQSHGAPLPPLGRHCLSAENHREHEA